MSPNAASDSPPAAAERCCDIVLKGGVVSGVVYPTALHELAQAYRFRSIGGTSIGAVAAACAAAAEYRRHTSPPARRLDGFEILRSLPEWLCCPDDTAGNVRPLFRPDAATKRYYDTIVAALRRRGKRRLLAVPLATPRRFPVAALLGAVPGLLVLLATTALLWRFSLPLAIAVAAAVALVLVGVAVVAVGAVAGATVAFVRGGLRAVCRNDFGLCRGSLGSAQYSGRVPRALEELEAKPLTDWLADLIDLVAGKTGSEPLTFGDLWTANAAGLAPIADDVHERDRAIRLQMVTTCLSLGRPYRLPFEGTSEFYFRREDSSRFFPPRIVEHLEACSKSEGDYLRVAGGRLPVVVAARLSLSFPFLFSAVPLYIKDAEGRFRRCWFSDGGITSNFPIHFFDALLPRWPTFGINLRGPRYRGEAEPDVVGSVKDFASSIVDALRNWSDDTQLGLPGWSDRIAHVPFGEDEGGLNLALNAETIRLLARRGEEAGRQLVARFGFAEPVVWRQNRWTRYRATMSALTVMFERLQRGWDGRRPAASPPCEPDPEQYEDLIRALGSEGQWRWADDEQRDAAKAATDALFGLISVSFSDARFDGGPEPKPILRIAPDI